MGDPSSLESAVFSARRVRLSEGYRQLEALGAGALVPCLDTAPPQLANAVLDHALAALEPDALDRTDAHPADVTPAAVEPLLVETSLGPRLVACCPGLSTRDVSRGAKPLLFAHEMVPAADVGDQLARTLDLIARLRDFPFVAGVLGALIVTEEHPKGDYLAHATSGKLIGTIYSNPIDEDWRFGEMIVHESAHSWLNECARAVGERFAARAMFPSPWKRRERPLVLFIQAVFAFTAVARYQQLLLRHDLMEPAARTEIAEQLSWNLEQIEDAASWLDAAIGLVHEALRPLILQPFDLVRSEGFVTA